MSVTSVTTNRITGLASGLDTDSLVTSMLSVDQSRLDKQNQTTTKLEWEADALRDVNSLIKTFRESYLSVLNSSSNMLSSSSYNANEVSMLTTTNAVTVSAGSSAVTGQMTINKITQLATAAKATSSDVFSEEISKSTALKDLAFNTALTFDGDNNVSFSINDVDFTFSQDMSLNDMMSEINASDAGVKMSYSSLKNGFTIASTETGSASEVNIVNTSGNLFGYVDGEGNTVEGALGISEGITNGEDAELIIEDIPVTKSSNTFTIDGITYTLKDESEEAISFTVEQDIESTVDKISTFVDAYNELVGTLQDMIDEDVYRDYDPLTDDQKAEMSETEIEQWEEKAKSGLLSNNSGIESLLTTVRRALYTTVEGAGMSLSDIGLTTGTYTDGAKITLDEDKLRTALENNPDAVTSLFTQTSSSDDSSTKFSESGFVARVSNALLNYTEQATDVSLTTLQDEISDSEDRADTLEDRLYERSEALYLKFSAMEAALATLNSQSSWLSSLFSTTSSS